jgi:hypothetical protein
MQQTGTLTALQQDRREYQLRLQQQLHERLRHPTSPVRHQMQKLDPLLLRCLRHPQRNQERHREDLQ